MNIILISCIFASLLSCYPVQAQVWELVNPKPHNQWLFDTYFIDKDNGWAVGYAGLILKTTDGGINWSNESGIYKDTPKLDFYGVYFEDENTGWLSGQTYNHSTKRDQAWVLKTQNGGISWDTSLIVTHPDTSFLFNAINYIDKQNAYVVGHYGFKDVYKPLVYKTTNAGLSWTSCTDFFPEGNFLLFDAYFINTNVGWVAGQIDEGAGICILKTTDGGANWHVQLQRAVKSGGIRTIQFYDDKIGWASGTTTLANSDTVGVLLKTEDGGENWLIDSTIAGGHSNFNTLFFHDKENGFLAGRTTLDGKFAATIYKTSDGGLSWTQTYRMDSSYYSDFNGSPYSFRAIHFPDKLNGAFVGVSGVIVSTVDGGLNWQHRFSNQLKGSLRGLQFIDSLIGWTYSFIDSKLYKTRDGGLNWNEQIYTNEKANRFDGFFFLNKNIGWIIPQMYRDFLNSPNAFEGQVFKTTNGGNSWVFQYKIPGTHYNSNFKDVFFTDENRGWIVGNYYPLPSPNSRKGFILTTSDGGNNWNFNDKITNLTKLDLSSLFFIDENNGWICGSFLSDQLTQEPQGKLIFKTSDGGKTWINTYNEQPPKKGFLDGIYFRDKLNGWIAGTKELLGSNDDEAGLILRTRDGGLNWDEVSYSDNFWWLKHPKFINSQKGFITGNNLDRKGAILFTENGGEDWITISKTSYNWLYAYHFIGKYLGWAVTSDGAVYKYKHLYIQTGVPSKTEYCTGESIQVPFIFPDSLRYNITFVAQISDSTGSFDYSPVIGTSDRHKSGYIDAVIPDDVPPGDYKIRVWFSENDYSIKVSAAPAPNISGPVNVCKGTVAHYFSGDSSGTQYIWSIEGGSFVGDSTGQSVNVIWNEIGFGKISVNVSKTRISCQGVSDLRVKVSESGNIPNHSIEGPELICHTDSDVHEYVSSEQGVKNTWSVSRGTIIGDSVGNSIKVKFLPGIDTVFLKSEVITGGCITEINKIVKVDTNNLTRTINGQMYVCPNNEYEYSTPDKFGNTYKWSSDKGIIISDDSSETVRIRFTQNGLNLLNLQVSSPFGCIKTSTISIDVGIEEMGIIGDSVICNDTTLVYTYFSKYRGLVNLWTVSNSGEIIGEPNLDSVRVRWHNQDGIKLIRLKQTLNDGCSGSSSKILQYKSTQIVISIPEVRYNPAEYYDNIATIPIYFESLSCISSFSANDSLTLIIKTAKSLFLPLKKDNISWTDIDDWRRIEIKLNASDISSENSNYELEGYLLLGDRIESPIIIDTLLHSTDQMSLIRKDGKLILEGVPNVGGWRLLTQRKLQIISINPNPNDGRFKIKLYSKSKQIFTQSIEDLLGNMISETNFEADKGENSFEFNYPNLPSGSYFLKIKGNNSLDTKLIIISK